MTYTNVRRHVRRKPTGGYTEVVRHDRELAATPTPSKVTVHLPAKKMQGWVQFDKPVLTEAEVNLLKNRLNHGKLSFDDLRQIERYNDGDGWELSPEQTEKGREFLVNLWMTERCVERKNNPFGQREQDTLAHFKSFTLVDFYDVGNQYVHFNVPVYRVNSTEGGGFDYYYSTGNVHIIG